MSDCVIDFSPLPLPAWDERFRTIRRSTLLQHFPFAQANRAVNQTGARHGIIRIDGNEAGLVQLSEVGVIRNLFHAVSLDRGPLWFDGFGTAEHISAFFTAFARQFPRRMGRKIRLLPEVRDTSRNRRAVAASGFARRETMPGYETIWVDLTAPPDTLRANLNGKWRNILSKAERSGLEVDVDFEGESAAGFLASYRQDRTAKGYDGPSLKLLVELFRYMIPRREAVILNACAGGETVAAILVLVHGASATYQVGWTTPDGRRLGAHHRLLWQAMLTLRDAGISDFDLGGVNDATAAGVKRFKQGLGGTDVTLAGYYS